MVMANVMNCWEYKKCGKEKSCPAYPNEGRLCFGVEGTLCMDKKQGDYQEKIQNCRANCDFYKNELMGQV